MVRQGSRAACGTLVAAALIVVLPYGAAAAAQAEARYGAGPVLLWDFGTYNFVPEERKKKESPPASMKVWNT